MIFFRGWRSGSGLGCGVAEAVTAARQINKPRSHQPSSKYWYSFMQNYLRMSFKITSKNHTINPHFNGDHRCYRNDVGFPGGVWIIFQQPLDQTEIQLWPYECSTWPVLIHDCWTTRRSLGNTVPPFRLSSPLKWENTVWCHLNNSLNISSKDKRSKWFILKWRFLVLF